MSQKPSTKLDIGFLDDDEDVEACIRSMQICHKLLHRLTPEVLEKLNAAATRLCIEAFDMATRNGRKYSR